MLASMLLRVTGLSNGGRCRVHQGDRGILEHNLRGFETTASAVGAFPYLNDAPATSAPSIAIAGDA